MNPKEPPQVTPKTPNQTPSDALKMAPTIVNIQRFAEVAQTHGETGASFETRAHRISGDTYGSRRASRSADNNIMNVTKGAICDLYIDRCRKCPKYKARNAANSNIFAFGNAWI